MCWCLRVYCTVFHNLILRCFHYLNNVFLCNNNNECIELYACCCCCNKYKQINRNTGIVNNTPATTECDFIGERLSATNNYLQNVYVIVDDIDANYLEIERRKIETEPYYRTVDRTIAEDILACREDGACLVRPYKEMDISIKYIVSIYAQQNYFHLFIRQIAGKEHYGIGQEKPNERVFQTPSDIIDFYSYNSLLCTNKSISISVILKPIVA